MGVAEGLGLLEDVLLDVLEQILDILGNALNAAGLLLECVSAHHFDGAVLQVAGTENQAYGHTFQFIVGELEAGTLVVGIVELHGDTL